jgi:hypothetical protein
VKEERRRRDLFTSWLWEGEWTVGGVVVAIKGFLEDSERLIEQVCSTAQGDVNLLESLLPSPFLVEDLKTSMMFIHDRLFRIEHKTIDGCHRCLPFV